VEAGLPVPQPGFRVAVAFYPGTWRQLRNPSWKPGIPLSILIGLKDDWTPAEGCVRLAERIHAQGLALDLVTYPNANHGFDAPKVPLHVRTGVNSHTGSATVGTDPDARQDALTHTMTIFHQALD
jgi:dienelactone hydrolase